MWTQACLSCEVLRLGGERAGEQIAPLWFSLLMGEAWAIVRRKMVTVQVISGTVAKNVSFSAKTF